MNTNSLIDNIFAADQARGGEEILSALEEIKNRVRALPLEERRVFNTWMREVQLKTLSALNDSEEFQNLQHGLEEGSENDMEYAIERLIKEERQKNKEQEKIIKEQETRANELEVKLITNLLQQGVSIDNIIQTTGASRERVEEIQKEILISN